MNKTAKTSKDADDQRVRGIKRKTRKHSSAEEKIRIVLAGLRGEESIATLCRREGIAESLHYSWSNSLSARGRLQWFAHLPVRRRKVGRLLANWLNRRDDHNCRRR